MSSILISKIVFLHAACIPQICEFNIDSSNFLIYTVIQKGLCAIKYCAKNFLMQKNLDKTFYVSI